MNLVPGTKLGPYEILAPLGAGGMGEVYRAKDTRLGREVAIKVLPEHLSANAEVRARFEREAKTVSSLNHPNICTLFDVGREGDTDYLVMELIEGDTLAARLRKGPLPAPELLRLAVQIADALDRAHRANVIHRDLKPGNVMLTRTGAKLMDFGLARAAGLAPSSGSGVTSPLTQSPTVGQALTTEGTIVGTYQYMAPEQLEGREADARSDVWALGCVLYEMATGRRAFEGRSQASLIAAILEREPASIAEAPSGAPPAASSAGGTQAPAGLDRLVRACLAKDPEDRVQSAHAVKQQLQWLAEGAGLAGFGSSAAHSGALPGPVAASRAPRGGAARLPWLVAGLALAGAAAFGAWAWPRLHAAPPGYRFEPDVQPPGTRSAVWPRLAPDGRSLVFVADDTSGSSRAYLLRLDAPRATPIPGSEDVNRVYWSPDSREIAFVTHDRLQRLAVAGGSPVTVCPAPGGADLSWSAKGLILMDGSATDSLRVVPAGGGELRPASRIDRARNEVGSAWPSFLPDGEHFLFCATRSDGETMNLRLGRLGSLESKLLGETDGRAELAPGGFVLYVRGTRLVAQKLDVGAGRFTGEPITLVDDLRIGSSAGHFSVSATGVLAVQHADGSSDAVLRLADRSGALGSQVLGRGTLGNPQFSPDGRRISYEFRGAPGTSWGDLSVHDLERGTDTRLTFTNGSAVRSCWSPDGQRIAWTQVTKDGRTTAMIRSADGLGAPDSIVFPSRIAYLAQWAAAGSRLTFYTGDGHLFEVDADGPDRVVRALGDTTQFQTQPNFSPDGRWLATTISTSNTNYNVFVTSAIGPPGRWQISLRLGAKPRWTRGGRELIFESSDGWLMAVDIDTANGFHPGTPRQLFRLPVGSFGREIASWGVDASGERFLVVARDATADAADRRTIEVITDFRSLVSRK